MPRHKTRLRLQHTARNNNGIFVQFECEIYSDRKDKLRRLDMQEQETETRVHACFVYLRKALKL